MDESSEIPEPSYTRVQLSGPPQAVARLMAALGSAGEIIFDHRAEPDVRGDVECTARVATYSAPGPKQAPGRTAAVMQSTLILDAVCWPLTDECGDTQRLEACADAALSEVEGVHAVSSRLVAVTAPASAQ